jgi:hypothetical protein
MDSVELAKLNRTLQADKVGTLVVHPHAISNCCSQNYWTVILGSWALTLLNELHCHRVSSVMNFRVETLTKSRGLGAHGINWPSSF